MSDTKYTIAEDYCLPSGGEIYAKEFSPFIKLRSMTVRDEMKRTSQTALPHKTLCEIIDDCLLTKLPISSYDMAIGDYEYLLHKLRVVTYGPEYKMIVGCPHCEKYYEATINLDDLKIRNFKYEDFKEAITVTLPVKGDVVELNFETPRMRDMVKADVDKFMKDTPNAVDPTLLFKIKRLIHSVNGQIMSPIELEEYAEKLSARDGNFILQKTDKLTAKIGLDTSLDVKCTRCGGDIKTFFRFGPEFFGPAEN